MIKNLSYYDIILLKITQISAEKKSVKTSEAIS
jgi:hypothetical protein